jgi:hypothetical protein
VSAIYCSSSPPPDPECPLLVLSALNWSWATSTIPKCSLLCLSILYSLKYSLLTMSAHCSPWVQILSTYCWLWVLLVVFKNTVVRFVLGTTEVPSKLDLTVKLNLVWIVRLHLQVYCVPIFVSEDSQLSLHWVCMVCGISSINFPPDPSSTLEPVGTSCVTDFEAESRDFTIESQSIPRLHQSSPRTHTPPLKVGHLQTQKILVRKPSHIPTVSHSSPLTHTQSMCCLCILYPEIATRKSQHSSNSMVC